MSTHYLAVDLGAESGRIMLGTLSDEDILTLEEIHRFPNNVVARGEALHWDLDLLEAQIFAGLDKAAGRGLPISGISTDSWGVDYVLLDKNGAVLVQPRAYRDPRTAEASKQLLARLPFKTIYSETGIQFMEINTIYHFEAEDFDTLMPSTFLTTADYFNSLFSGVKVVEESLASTTQLYNPVTRSWSEKIIRALDISPSIFPRVVGSATVLGPVSGFLYEKPAFVETQVIATCSHDTGDAVAAVPVRGDKPWAYLSSGTWSLLGAELEYPVINEASRTAGFTNEVGLGGRIRFLKNIAGLWIVQECRRAWEAAGTTYSYDDLTRLAVENGPAQAHISMDDSRFVSTGGMPDKIAAYCRETNQPVPGTHGAFVRTVLESLALCYAETLAKLEDLIGKRIEVLYIVGGGTRNDLLNQLTANAVKRPVIIGPVEATAIGNVLIQAYALDHIESSAHLREIVEASFPTRTFLPETEVSRGDAENAEFRK